MSRGTYEDQEVVVKALPTDAWRNRVRKSFDGTPDGGACTATRRSSA